MSRTYVGFLCHICWLCLMIGRHSSSCHKKGCRANTNVARRRHAVGTAETNWRVAAHRQKRIIFEDSRLWKPGASLPGVCNCVECGQECFQVRGQSLWCVSSLHGFDVLLKGWPPVAMWLCVKWFQLLDTEILVCVLVILINISKCIRGYQSEGAGV